MKRASPIRWLRDFPSRPKAVIVKIAKGNWSVRVLTFDGTLVLKRSAPTKTAARQLAHDARKEVLREAAHIKARLRACRSTPAWRTGDHDFAFE